MDRERIDLTGERATLLITVMSKAQESRRANPIIHDPSAQAVLDRADYDFKALRVPRKSSIMVAMRARKLDDLVQNFIDGRDQPTVVNLGCGLDGRFARVKRGNCEWYDLDFPDVIELRKKFFETPKACRLIGSSATDLSWLDQVSPGGNALIVAEGLLMYLKESEVKALLLALRDRFPGCVVAFDAFSVLTARSAQAHPSVRRTGASFHWGIDDPRDIETWAPGIRLLEEWYFSRSEDLDKLSAGMRMMFRFSGLFALANRAHRVLVYQLDAQ
jgi:O-methyltransferase involved in polyketide biosynthesis